MSAISDALKNKIRREARNRCGYCLTPQEIVSIPLEIEHLHPIAAGGTDDEENLWLACRNCNGFKHAKTHAADPQTNIETAILIRENKFGANTSSWAKTKPKLPAKPLADARRSPLCV
jgi:5-methylcytosine-specific restriction endonuclease McrA